MGYAIGKEKLKIDSEKPLKVMKKGPNGLGPKLKDHNKRRYTLVDLSKVGLGRSEHYKKEQEERFGEKI